MRDVMVAVTAIVLSGPLSAADEQPGTADQQIAETVQVLPDDLRAGATVGTYDAATGTRTVLRQGTNFIECQPRMADGFDRCYHKSLAPRRDLEAKLRGSEED
jgi:hypothetical protein